MNDAPIYSSDNIAFDFDVPFYELVFKGYVPLSSVSINLCSDKDNAILRCAESGISPSYTVYGNFKKNLLQTIIRLSSAQALTVLRKIFTAP